jgi:hypothetical protein
MKNKGLLLCVLGFMLLVLSSQLLAPTHAQTKPEFSPFWQRFKAAISKNDKEAVASMTRLPFLYDNKERSRAEFLKIYPQLFTPKVRRCIVRARPQPDGENYDVFCGELIFYFGKDGNEYKLLEFGPND